MRKKKMMMSLAMAAMLTISAGFSTVAYAEEPAQTDLSETKTAAEQSNEQNSISISSSMDDDIEAEIGTSQTLMIYLTTTDSSSSIDLSNYELFVNRLSGDSNIVVNGKDSLEGIVVGGIVVTTLDLSYEIPQAQDLTGTNLKFTLQIKDKESGAVIGESPEYTIYPYEIKDGVLTYRDTSKNPKYLLTVEPNDYIDTWSLNYSETVTMIYDKNTDSISYYLDPDYPNVLFLKPKSGCLIKNVELTPSQAGTIKEVENAETSIRYTVQIKEPAAVKATCVPATEAKVWQSVVEDYINEIRFTDWFTGDEINNHFFKDAAPVNDIASVTLSNLNYEDYFYNAKTHNYEIPYDEFVTLAKDYFVNVPDLTGVDFYRISYDPTSNCMLVPSGGIGNPMLVTEFVKATDIGNGRYALHFNVSKEEWEEEKPDMGNKDAYTECTLTVEAGNKGLWKYVSFEKGYTNGTTVENETSAIIEKIENAETGSSVAIDMSQSTVVSKDVLAAAKGKDVNLVLEMDGYSWVINGKDIQNVKDLDLDVAFDTNAIPADIVKAIAGNHHTKQLSLAYDGQFGLKAKLQINVGKDYVKQYGNLYWYHNDALELTDTNQVDENGILTLTFNHASDYVIVFDNQAHQTTAPDTSIPKTGDVSPIAVYTVLLLAAGGFLVLAWKKKRI